MRTSPFLGNSHCVGMLLSYLSDYHDMKTLWTNIGRRFISMGAAGWHICFDVLDHLLSGTPIGRIVGREAIKFGGWQRLNAEYAKQLGIETPNGTPQAA